MIYTVLALLLSALNFYFYFALEEDMAVTRAEFDTLLQDAVTTIISKIDDLAAKVAAGTVTTPEDFQAEADLLKTAVAEALAKDPNPASPTA